MVLRKCQLHTDTQHAKCKWWEIKVNKEKCNLKDDWKTNKKHSENADTSTSVTFDLELWPRLMSLDVVYCIYIGTRYDVCECNSLRHMTISSFFVTFDFRLWPSSSVKVNFIFIIRWTLCCCVGYLVPSTKFPGSIEFEIWTIVWRKLNWSHNDVISHSNFMKIIHKATKGINKWHTEFRFDQV